MRKTLKKWQLPTREKLSSWVKSVPRSKHQLKTLRERGLPHPHPGYREGRVVRCSSSPASKQTTNKTTVVPALGRHRQGDLWVQSQEERGEGEKNRWTLIRGTLEEEMWRTDLGWVLTSTERKQTCQVSGRELAQTVSHHRTPGFTAGCPERGNVITGVFLNVLICWVWCHMYIAFVL